MATSVPNSKITSHSRSISLPNASHPLLATAEEHLVWLKSSEDASSSLSRTLTSHRLDGLRNLYECLDDLLRLPLSHQHILRDRNGTWEEQILDGSLRLLEICGTIREAYSMMKESTQELESSLRRRRGGNMDSEIDAYMITQKKLNILISNCHMELKRSEKKRSKAAVNGDSALPLADLIKEVQEMSLSVLESSLSFISRSKHSRSQPKARYLVSKLLQSRGESDISSEFQKLDTELMLLHCKNSKSNKDGDILPTQILLKQLGALGSNIQEVADLLEVVFRLLLKARVSLLNILNR